MPMNISRHCKWIAVFMLISQLFWLPASVLSQEMDANPDYSEKNILVRFAAKAPGLQRSKSERSQLIQSGAQKGSCRNY